MARYGRAVLLIIEYPDEAAAAAASEKFTKALMPAAENGLSLQDDGMMIGCRQNGPLVKVIADTPDKNEAERLLAFMKGVEDEQE